MSQIIEIEFKNMLTEPEYHNLLKYFNYHNKQIKQQTNIYFDTLAKDLKQNSCALRVRIKNDELELTLKQKHTTGHLETTDIINESEFNLLLTYNIIPQKEVFSQLQKIGIENKLVEIARLTTFRYECEYRGQIIAIDKSVYYGFTDYEIELETNNYEEGKQIFNNLLTQHSIPKRTSQNKIVRVTNYKNSL